MKKSVFLGVFVAGVVLFGSCGGNKQQQYVEEDDNSTSMEDKEVTDRTIYGICTAGTAMNTLEMITDNKLRRALINASYKYLCTK